MRVAERRTADAGDEIKIAFTGAGEGRGALAVVEHHGGARIHMQHVLRVEGNRIGRGRRQHCVQGASDLVMVVPGACAYSPARPSTIRTSVTPPESASRQAPSLATMPSRAVPAATIARAASASRTWQVLPAASNTPAVFPAIISRAPPAAFARCAASGSAFTVSSAPAAPTATPARTGT